MDLSELPVSFHQAVLGDERFTGADFLPYGGPRGGGQFHMSEVPLCQRQSEN